MNVNEFALATGFNAEYIRNACRLGRIPHEMWNGKIEISPGLVPLWAAKKNRKHKKSGRTIHNDVYLYQCALDNYNKKHDKDLSYGQAVAMGVICDE